MQVKGLGPDASPVLWLIKQTVKGQSGQKGRINQSNQGKQSPKEQMHIPKKAGTGRHRDERTSFGRQAREG